MSHVCDFCGKPEDKVAFLIVGPKADICDECVDACVEMVNKDRKPAPPTPAAPMQQHAVSVTDWSASFRAVPPGSNAPFDHKC